MAGFDDKNMTALKRFGKSCGLVLRRYIFGLSQLVLRINICGKYCHFRQAAKRYSQF
jgi:hypothetical protein